METNKTKNNNRKAIDVGFLASEVSLFANAYDREPKTISLGEFLFDMSVQYRDKIGHLRTIEDKELRSKLKRELPQATVSGVFLPTRKAENLIRHSCLFCVDIDAKDNDTVEDFDMLKQNILSRMPEVAYASRSVGGKGYFAIIPLAHPNLHRRQFKALQIAFARYGITIDNACSDVCRLRCLSYDKSPYLNVAARAFQDVYQEYKPSFQSCRRRRSFADDTDERVYMACREIERCRIDMTADYGTWIQLGFSLASLGEEGREYFHIISRQNPKYNQRETDQKFTSFLRGNNRVSIGTFFHFCKQFGVPGIG